MFLKEEYLIIVPKNASMEHKLMYDLCVALDIIVFNIVSIGWYLGSVCIYGYFVYSIGKLNEVYFNHYAAKGVVESRCHFRSMRCVWTSITNIKNQFDELFSIQVRKYPLRKTIASRIGQLTKFLFFLSRSRFFGLSACSWNAR